MLSRVLMALIAVPAAMVAVFGMFVAEEYSGYSFSSDCGYGLPFSTATWAVLGAIELLALWTAGFAASEPWRGDRNEFGGARFPRAAQVRNRVVLGIGFGLTAYGWFIHVRNWQEWHDLLRAADEFCNLPDPQPAQFGWGALLFGGVALAHVVVAFVVARRPARVTRDAAEGVAG